MKARTPAPPLPAEALARRERLHRALREAERRGPSAEAGCLQELRRALAGGPLPEAAPWLASVEAAKLAEEAQELLRGALREGTPDPRLVELGRALAPLATREHARRADRWHLDTHRTTVRLTYAKELPAADFDEGDLAALFLHALRLEGLPLALDLGKRPRPLVTPALPLAAGVLGAAEQLDLVLRREPAQAPGTLLSDVGARLPEGIRLLGWEPLPAHASPVAERALRAHWRWTVPAALQPGVAAALDRFQAAAAWPWDRGGTRAAPLDLRQVLADIAWTGADLAFTSDLQRAPALNPVKVLAAVTGLEAAAITGACRTAVDLAEDARLAQADRYQPKLRNMYEDAVLLTGGSNVVLVDEDDDEPLRLG